MDMFGNACGVIGSPLHKILDGKADAYVMNENAKIIENQQQKKIMPEPERLQEFWTDYMKFWSKMNAGEELFSTIT